MSLHVQSRGELRRELTTMLRTARTKRKSQERLAKRGQIVDMVNISERPAEVSDRAVPGHWEWGFDHRRRSWFAVATLVERQTRFVMLAYLGADQSTAAVIAALTRQIGGAA
jgi:IS30 family transposase